MNLNNVKECQFKWTKIFLCHKKILCVLDINIQPVYVTGDKDIDNLLIYYLYCPLS